MRMWRQCNCPPELAQLDQDASDTDATGELSYMNQPGKFPEKQDRLGLASDLVGA